MITDTGMACLRDLPVKILYLGNSAISDTDLAHIGRLTSLQRLSLSGTGITDRAVEHVAGLRSLEYLNLENTGVTDAGLVYLQDLSSLRELRLRNTHITDDGLSRLRGLLSLEKLDVRETQVSSANVASFRKALPKCQIKGVSSIARKPAVRDRSVQQALVGKPAPELAFEGLLQAPPDLDVCWRTLAGKVVVLEFWATWCGPCIKALPHTNAMVEEFSNRPVQFIAVTDESEATVADFLKRYRLLGWVALDTDVSVFKLYSVTARPCTVVVDANGVVAAVTRPDDLTPELINSIFATMSPSGSVEDE